MRIRRMARYFAGGAVLAALGYAVAMSAVAPVSLRLQQEASMPPRSAATPPPSAQTAQNAGSAAVPSLPSFTPKEQISADKPVSFPADI